MSVRGYVHEGLCPGGAMSMRGFVRKGSCP